MSQPAPSTALDYPDPLRIPISPTSTESAQSPSARAQSAPAHRDDHKGTASLFSDYSSPRAEPQEPQNRPRKISHSDDSWSQVSASPVLQPASHGRGDAQSPAASNPPRDSCQPASALSRNAIEDQLSRQEAQGMLTTVTRSQSDFSRWLETTVSQARGDGTSTIGSDDASYQNLIELTRQARESIGFGPSESSVPEHQHSNGPQIGLGSAFELRASEDEYYGDREGDRSMGFDQSENFDDVVLVDSEEKVVEKEANARGEGAEELEVDGEGDMSVFIEPGQVNESIEQISSKASPRQSPRLLRKSFTFVATLLLQAGILYLAIKFDIAPHIQSFMSSLHPSAHSHSPSHNVTIEIPLEEEFIPGPPTSLATPLSLESVAQVAAFVGLVVLGRFAMSYGRSKTSSPFIKLERSPSPPPSTTSTPSQPTYHEALASGIYAYTLANLPSALAFLNLATTLLPPTASPKQKATTFEWLGRTLYRLERYDESLVAFKRSIRFNSKNFSARASAGRTYFRMREYAKAEMTFRNAGLLEMKEAPAFAWEFMGKSLVALGRVREAEGILTRGVEMDSSNCRLSAYLGELLHVLPAAKAEGGGSIEAKKLLEGSLALRLDQPVIHLRLAFINNQSLDAGKACHHLTEAIKFRESGFIDTTSAFSLQLAQNNLQGSAPYLYLYFSTPIRSANSLETRLAILGRAKEIYEGDWLVRTLWATGMRRSGDRASRDAGGKELRIIERELSEMDKGKIAFDDSKGSKPMPVDATSIERQGLVSLVLSGLGRKKEADEIYDSFWQNLRHFTDSLPPADKSSSLSPSVATTSANVEKGPPDFTFLIMAFYEAKGAKTLSRVR